MTEQQMPEQEVLLHQTIANEETFARFKKTKKQKTRLFGEKNTRRNASEIKEHNMKRERLHIKLETRLCRPTPCNDCDFCVVDHNWAFF